MYTCIICIHTYVYTHTCMHIYMIHLKIFFYAILAGEYITGIMVYCANSCMLQCSCTSRLLIEFLFCHLHYKNHRNHGKTARTPAGCIASAERGHGI